MDAAAGKRSATHCSAEHHVDMLHVGQRSARAPNEPIRITYTEYEL